MIINTGNVEITQRLVVAGEALKTKENLLRGTSQIVAP